MPIVSDAAVALLRKQLVEVKAELETLIQPIYDADQELPKLRREVTLLEQSLQRNLARRKELEDLAIVLEAMEEDRG